jgi:predicted Fe-Mo cluster-binding NifX family protein
MKIAVATTSGGLEDNVSPVFGRCSTYTLVEVEGENIKKTEIIPNQVASAMGGAGIQAAQLIASQGSEAVIAGNFGPNASTVLIQASVKMVQAQGNVKDAVVKYANGQLQSVSEPTTPMNAGRGGGMGGGRGGGMGRGRGGGRGGGRGRWQTPSTTPQAPLQPVPEYPQTPAQSGEQELANLKDYMKSLQHQIDEVKNRIDKLKKEE